MKFLLAFMLCAGCWVGALVAVSVPMVSQEVPDAPRVVDRKFLGAAAFQMAATAADGFTTFQWKKCSYEESSPWLYGRHPSPKKMSLILAGESVGSVALGWWLKKTGAHIGPVKLWALPMLASGTGHLGGTIHNLRNCT